MATLVKSIHDSIVTIATAELGSTFQTLRFVYEPEKNDLRSGAKAFGVIVGPASSASGITKHITLDQTFTVLLMDVGFQRNSDDIRKAAILELFNQADELFKEFHLSKLSLPAIVLNVFDPSMDQPEILENDNVLIRMNFTVKYRSAVS